MSIRLPELRPFALVVAFEAIVALAFICSGLARAANWQGANVGGATGSDSVVSDGVFTINGSGMGLMGDGDHMRFVYQTIAAGGNFRLTARLASFTGDANSAAGLIVRNGLNNPCSCAAIIYRPQAGAGLSPNSFQVVARNNEPGALNGRGATSNFKMGAPCYLQLVRWGNNFAVYLSDDGVLWAPISNTSGSVFSVQGPINVGLFVASGSPNTVTATFDHVNLDTSPVLPYETSWLGNSFSSDYDSYVSGGMNGMYVAPDGTCYCISGWDEGGEFGKIYKDGKVVGTLPNPAGMNEHSITTDGTHLYYYFSVSDDGRGLYRLNRFKSESDPPRLLFLQTPIVDPKKGNMMAGLAWANNELYVSDALTNQILVVHPDAQTYTLQRNGVLSQAHIDTSTVPNPAPQLVYQTFIQSSGAGVVIPGVKSGATYKVRLHFAETDPACAAPGKRLMDVRVGPIGIPIPNPMVANYDIFKAAGAINKATTLDFNNVPGGTNGQLSVSINKASGSQASQVILCGVEVLNSDGSPFLAVNCGGGPVGSWVSGVHEIPSRDFSVAHAGPITPDKAGQLWIMHEARDFPVAGQFTYTPGTGSIKLYDKNGKYLNKQITDLDNPGAMGYDATRDRLLVCENGPAQNIRIYDVFTGTDKAPVLERTLGYPGGIFAGPTPGLIHDDRAGGDARFLGPTGVGADQAGNIYVLCNMSNLQNELMSFKPDGKLNWQLFSLDFCNTGDFDPAHPEDLWTTTKHYKMNWKTTVPGGEWTLKAFTTNPASKIPYPGFLGASNSVLSRVYGKPYLFTGGQGFMGEINIWRFSGEQAVPCGQIKPQQDGMHLWVDANGDGTQQPNEITFSPNVGNGDLRNYSFDPDGNIYLLLDNIKVPHVQRVAFQGINSIGSPTYDIAHSKAQPFPPPFDHGISVRGRCIYAGGPRDTMYLMGATRLNAPDGNCGGTLACYDHWNTAPVQRFVTVLPDPSNSPLFSGQPPFGGDGFIYMAMDVANGYAFCSTLMGHIFVVDPSGHIVQLITPGPEVSGQGAWDDEAMGLRAHYLPSTGEYVILQENSGWRGRENLYRIRSLPPASTGAAGNP